MDAVEVDTERQRGLRRMKAVALGLLILAAIVYVITTVVGPEGWIGYVQAFAEAAMVGALADWFAVTALFRHPLGIPIPHTAIIPRRKDQIGRSLGEFVENNFMTSELLAERLDQALVGRRLGTWLSSPANADRAAGAIGDVLKGGLEVLDDTAIQHDLEAMIRRRVRAVPAAPLAGRLIEFSMEGGHQQRLLDAVLTGLDGFLDDNRDTFRRRIYTESPWWVPEALDDRVLAKIYDVAQRFLRDVRADPDHEMRRAVDRRAAGFATRLAHDPDLRRRGERLTEEVLDHPEFRAWVESLWIGTKQSMIEAGDDPDSDLRRRLAATIRQFGERLAADAELQHKVDDWVARAVVYVAEHYRSEVSDLISSTVDRWDGESTARRMELQVGRDLQFIRINGTLVGGLAGLVIHALAELL